VLLLETRVSQEVVAKTELTTEEATELPEAGKFHLCFQNWLSDISQAKTLTYPGHLEATPEN